MSAAAAVQVAQSHFALLASPTGSPVAPQSSPPSARSSGLLAALPLAQPAASWDAQPAAPLLGPLALLPAPPAAPMTMGSCGSGGIIFNSGGLSSAAGDSSQFTLLRSRADDVDSDDDATTAPLPPPSQGCTAAAAGSSAASAITASATAATPARRQTPRASAIETSSVQLTFQRWSPLKNAPPASAVVWDRHDSAKPGMSSANQITRPTAPPNKHFLSAAVASAAVASAPTGFHRAVAFGGKRPLPHQDRGEGAASSRQRLGGAAPAAMPLAGHAGAPAAGIAVSAPVLLSLLPPTQHQQKSQGQSNRAPPTCVQLKCRFGRSGKPFPVGFGKVRHLIRFILPCLRRNLTTFYHSNHRCSASATFRMRQS